MKKFFLGFFLMLLVIALVAAVVLGYLFFKEYDKNKDLKDQLEQCQNDKTKCTTNETPTGTEGSTTPETLTFTDDGMNATATYPFAWQPVMTVQVSDEYANDQAQNLYGPIAEKYQLILKNGSARVKFSKILGGVGDVAAGLPQDTYNYVILENSNVSTSEGMTKLVRYQDKTAGKPNSWSYGVQTDCSNTPEGEQPGVDVCITHFFPGFGKANFATSASVEGATGDLLTQADEIAISALNQ